MHKIILIVITTLFIIPAYTQEKLEDIHYKIEHLENIPENDVNCIYKDSKGFMWIGTLDGLHRYDGYGFKSYRINNSSNSISSNMIIAIDEDSYGNIWIGTYGKGISKLDPVKEKFTNYFSDKERSNNVSNDISTLLVDRNDNIWTGNWLGTSRIKFKEGMSEIDVVDIFPLSKEDIKENRTIHKIFEDKNGNIWLGSNSGVKRVINPNGNAKQVRFEEFETYGEDFCEYVSGIISSGYRVHSITKEANNSYRARPLIQIPTRIALFHDNKFWAGRRNGVSIYEKIDDQLVLSKTLESGFDEQNLSSNIITSFEVDEIDRVWVGTRGGGVNIVSSKQKPFRHYRHTLKEGTLNNNLTRAIFEDSKQNLWIGFEENGASFLSKDKNYESDFESVEVNDFAYENRAYAIEEFSTPESNKHEALIFVGTSHPVNLSIFNRDTRERIEGPDLINRLGFVFALENVGDSVLWVGSYNRGLDKIKISPRGEMSDLVQYTPKSRNEQSVLSYIIRSIFLDSKNNLWIGTDKGLNLIKNHHLIDDEIKFESFVLGENEYDLPFDYILQIIEAKDGTIWMGTMGGGLIQCTPADNAKGFKFKSYTIDDGLPNNSIKSIVEDNIGNLWLSSNHGISQFNPRTEDVINFDKNDGLQDNEFSEICGLKRKNGEIVFGGLNGINVFKSEEIESDTIKPSLFFTNFFIDNKEIVAGEPHDGKIILKNSIEHTKSINLKYSDNSFSIEFLGLNLLAPQKNNYKYMLEGFDNQWYKSSPQHRIAKYTNIPAGTYTFKLLASNSNNVWADTPKELEIIIAPPPYFSPYAIILYFIALMSIILVFFRFNSILSIKKKELIIAQIEKNKVEEISQMKLKFFTNISHEFRTPLTLIKAPLDELRKKDHLLSESSRRKSYNIIAQNVNVLLRLVNQLMDFRKLDQDKLKLNCQAYHLNKFVGDIFQSFQPLAEKNNVQFSFTDFNRPIIAQIDPIKFEKVIYNLLSNAFKFTTKGGSINMKLDLKEQAQKICITVTDNGIGIKESDAEHIFERYYQNDDERKTHTGGTGIGLALTKGIVELHGGKIWFESTPETSTCFYVELPNKNDNEAINNERFVASDYDMAIDQDVLMNMEKEVLLEARENRIQKENTILIVEDNHDLRGYLSNRLSDRYKIVTAENGLEGLEKCKQKSPNLIITDVMMPVMTGIELCQKIKQDEEVSHIPVLVLTAKNTEETQIEGFKTGADAYLAKPFNIDVLSSNIESLLSNREKLRKKFQKDIEINPKIISNSPADSKFLDKILELIEDNLSDSDYNVEKISEDYGVSRIYLNRKIKALTGETTIEFMRNIKLKHAAELLKQNKLSVSEVAWEVGYNHLPTFRSRFKDKFDLSPSEFAKQYKDR